VYGAVHPNGPSLVPVIPRPEMGGYDMVVYRCPEYEYEAPASTVTRQEAAKWWDCQHCGYFAVKRCDGPRERR
jgi:hypothetical protein